MLPRKLYLKKKKKNWLTENHLQKNTVPLYTVLFPAWHYSNDIIPLMRICDEYELWSTSKTV